MLPNLYFVASTPSEPPRMAVMTASTEKRVYFASGTAGTMCPCPAHSLTAAEPELDAPFTP